MSEPPRKKLRHAIDEGPDMESDPVLVLVGASRQKFHVHEALLRSNSGFFDAALKKGWAEGQDRVVELPDKDSEIFRIWMKWIYTGRLFMTKEDDVTCGDRSSTFSHEWVRWREIFALADFLQDFDWKDAAIDALVEAMVARNTAPRHLATYVYPHSREHSAHRKLAVDQLVMTTSPDEFAMAAQDQPQEFLTDVMRKIGPCLRSGVKKISIQQLFASGTCQYHDRGPGKPCYKTKPAFRS